MRKSYYIKVNIFNTNSSLLDRLFFRKLYDIQLFITILNYIKVPK